MANVVAIICCIFGVVLAVMAFTRQPSITDEEILQLVVERQLAYKVASELSEEHLYQFVLSRQHMFNFVQNYIRDLGLVYPLILIFIFSLLGFLVFLRWFFLASAAFWKAAADGLTRFTRFMLYATRDFDPESIPLAPMARNVVSTHAVDESQPANEAAVQGSVLLGPNVPKFQCFIASVDENGKVSYVGSGVRIRDVVYTVRHNLVAVADTLHIYSHNGVDNVVAPVADWILSDEFDAACIRLHPSALSKLQLTKAVLPKGPLLGSTYACASSNLHSSTGLVKPSDTCGEVLYLGSTVAGFSGAPYFTGKTVYGVHVGVSGQNFGYDILFMDSLFYTPEDSETFDNEMLFDDWKNKRVHKFLRTNDGGFIHKGKNRFRRVDHDFDGYVRDLELDHMDKTGRGFDEGVLPPPRRDRKVVSENAMVGSGNNSPTLATIDAVIADPEPLVAPPVFRDVPAPPLHTTRPTGANKDALNLDSMHQIDMNSLVNAVKVVLDTRGLGLTPVQNESASPTTLTGSAQQSASNRRKTK